MQALVEGELGAVSGRERPEFAVGADHRLVELRADHVTPQHRVSADVRIELLGPRHGLGDVGAGYVFDKVENDGIGWRSRSPEDDRYEGQNPGQRYVVDAACLFGPTNTYRLAVVGVQLKVE